MAKPFQSKYRKVNLYKSQHEFEEFGPGKKGLVICSECEAVYFKKHWHHNLMKLNLSESLAVSKKDKSVKFVLCPACQMVKNRQFEGEVILKNVPEKLKEEVLHLVRGFCLRAYRQDPMDRLIDIKSSDKEIRVTLTENELANKLGKKIKHLFNNVKTKTTFSAEPSDVARVMVEFLSK